jgi:glutathione S-transferase
VQWIADQVPEKRLAPPAGTIERYRLQEWLTFIGTEIHKQFSPLFNPALPEEAKPLFQPEDPRQAGLRGPAPSRARLRAR